MVRYRLLELAAWLAPRVPLPVARVLAQAIGLAAWAGVPAARHRVRANLRRVPGLASDSERLRWATRGVFRHAALNYLDFLRGPYLSERTLRDKWAIEGQEVFDAAMAQGHGLVVMSGHFGNFEFGGSRLGAIGHSMVVPVEHLQPEALYQLFLRIRAHHGMRLLPADSRETLRGLMEALKRNAIIMFLADRYVAGSSIEVPLFGEPARLPTAPVALALRMGTPAMAVFSWREPGGYSHGLFVPLDLGGAGETASAGVTSVSTNGGSPTSVSATSATRTRTGEVTTRAMSVFVRALEERVTAHPEQWVSALSPIWPPFESTPGEASTAGRTSWRTLWRTLRRTSWRSGLRTRLVTLRGPRRTMPRTGR